MQRGALALSCASGTVPNVEVENLIGLASTLRDVALTPSYSFLFVLAPLVPSILPFPPKNRAKSALNLNKSGPFVPFCFAKTNARNE